MSRNSLHRLALGAAVHLCALFGALVMVVPYVELILSSLRTNQELFTSPPVIIPRTPQWANYTQIGRFIPVGLLLKNSLIVSGGITLLVLFTSLLAGFALAKYRFAGRDWVFRFILATLMFPQFVFIIPVYYLMKRWPLAGGNDIFGIGGTGLLQTYWALILPFSVSAFGIFLMRQFMLGIPDELLEAARIDGASDLRILATIVAPLCKPALATVAVFTFLNSYNEFVWPMTIAASARHLMTLPVGVQLLQVNFDPTRNAAIIRAALVISSLPVILLFVALQRYYVRGIVLTGLKN